MLEISFQPGEEFDESTAQFLKHPAVILKLEHSLVSLSKWESKWEKPFLSNDDKTSEETLSYINCMSLDGEIPIRTLQLLGNEQVAAINEYISSKMTATWFAQQQKQAGRQDIITAELIYYWMIEAGIPSEFEAWHLERLFTLIRVIGNKRSPDKKKMSRADLAARNRELNEQRRAQLGTSG